MKVLFISGNKEASLRLALPIDMSTGATEVNGAGIVKDMFLTPISERGNAVPKTHTKPCLRLEIEATLKG